MSEYKPLNDKQVQDIAQAYYDEYKKHVTPQEQPTLLIVGGQSGAGKSGAAIVAKSQLREKGGYIHVDADRMRERIPSTDGKRYPSHVTQPDAGRLANAVRSIVI